MAKFSQSKVPPNETDHLVKKLHALDDRVVMPESLRGSALLAKLEGVQPDVPTKKKVRELVLPKRNRVRFLVGYAAAFALVIGLFYNLGINRPVDIALGEVPIDGQVTELAPLRDGGGTGQEIATRLGEFGQYLLYLHPTPGYPIHLPYLLLLLCADGQAVISQVELPYQMNQISRFYVDGDIVTLVSRGGEQYVIDFADPQNPTIVLQ